MKNNQMRTMKKRREKSKVDKNSINGMIKERKR
jgi:hypothetical protein